MESLRAGVTLGALCVLAGVGWVLAERPPPPPALEASDELLRAGAPPATAPSTGASRAPQAVVYTGNRCTLHCPRQLRDLQALGIASTERNVDRDPAARRELRSLGGRPVLPTTRAGDALWRGYAPTHARDVLHWLRFQAGGDEAAERRLVIYTRSDCPFSRQLLEDLDALGLAYENRVVDRDAEALSALVRLMGQPSVPLAVVGGHIWHGFAPEHAAEIRAQLRRG